MLQNCSFSVHEICFIPMFQYFVSIHHSNRSTNMAELFEAEIFSMCFVMSSIYQLLQILKQTHSYQVGNPLSKDLSCPVLFFLKYIYEPDLSISCLFATLRSSFFHLLSTQKRPNFLNPALVVVENVSDHRPVLPVLTMK